MYFLLDAKSLAFCVAGDKPTNEEFLANLSAAAYSLQEKLPLVLQFVAGKSVSEL